MYDVIIGQLGRYRVSALLWDQGEADVSCNHTGVYACLERQLLRSWRQGLGITDMVPAVAIQLPGYDTDCRQYCTDLLSMRLAQAEGRTESCMHSAHQLHLARNSPMTLPTN